MPILGLVASPRTTRTDPLVTRVRQAGSHLDRPTVAATATGTVPSGGPRADAGLYTHPGAQPLQGDLERVLAALRNPTIWVDEKDRVVRAHPEAFRMRLIRAGKVRIPEILALVNRARQEHRTVGDDVILRRINPRASETMLRVRAAPMSAGAVLVLIEDLSEAARVDHIRRDFVANVSHELKTPVGAISLLAEAISDARDDPGLVGSFAERMRSEANRLANLVSDLMDLSRLEDSDPMGSAVPVAVDALVARACDDNNELASRRGIRFVVGGTPDLQVRGIESHLLAALRNLIDNAVNYSPEGTTVAISKTTDGQTVSVAVTDQGIGIPRAELERIFERFYRVDPARSRNTGGTGLGLAIVKHVCANHGGDCTVWSKPREGSTFTIRLPQLDSASDRAARELLEGADPDPVAPGEPVSQPDPAGPAGGPDGPVAVKEQG